MKRSIQIGFIALFLAIIYSVPIVQTGYEYRINDGHRIQMFDLAADIFVTPLKKARSDARLIDSLIRKVELLDREVKNAAASSDSVVQSDYEKVIGYGDEATITITLLKQSVIDYNRHLQGTRHALIARDTLKPYYRALVRTDSAIAALVSTFQDNSARASLAQNISTMKSAALSLQKLHRGINYPALTLTALRRIMVGPDYLRPYEKEMEKSSVFANAVRPWMLLGAFNLFGDPGSKGVMGERPWLFYRPDVDYLIRPSILDRRSRDVDANDVPITEDIIGTIVDFKKQLAERGTDLLFVIMPTKASIYPDLLNPSARPGASGISKNSREVMERLQKAGVETVDLFTAFAQERENDRIARDSLYLHTDTHFKGRGVVTAARVIAERVKRYPWYRAGTAEFAIDTVLTPRIGDIAEMIGFPPKIVARHRYPFTPESTACYQVLRIQRDAAGAVADHTLYKDDYRSSNILVLGDSFSRMYQTDQPKSAGWISHLAVELAQPVASLVNDGGASTLVRQSLARKPRLLKNKKLVIWEVVERDFRFGEEGWKKIEIAK